MAFKNDAIACTEPRGAAKARPSALLPLADKPLCTSKCPPNTSSEEQLALALDRKNTCEPHQFMCQQTGGVRAQCAIQPWWTVAAVKKTSQRCTRTRNSGEGAPESLAFFFFFFGASLPSYIPSQMTQDTGWKTNCNTMLTVASGVCAAQRADARVRAPGAATAWPSRPAVYGEDDSRIPRLGTGRCLGTRSSSTSLRRSRTHPPRSWSTALRRTR